MDVPDPRVGSVLQGRYRILERKTAGSMGVVYRGERVALNRQVAIKFLHEGYAATDDGRRRFEVEARAMSRLTHPNCVPVTDFGLEDGSPYLVMDYVEGRTLRQLLVAEVRVEPPRAVAIVRQILAGVAHAHAQGIIHRDIKPENVLVTPVEGHGEHVHIVDFGLAKLRDDNSVTSGVAVGTPGYMSPEQTVGERSDERADVYACGIILYELLCGTKPFQADTPFEVMRLHREAPPPPLDVIAPDVEISARLHAVVNKALAKSREKRFQSASDFRKALETCAETQGQRRGRRALAGALGAVVVVIVATSAIVLWPSEPPTSSSDSASSSSSDPSPGSSSEPTAAPVPVAPGSGSARTPAPEPAQVAALRELAARAGPQEAITGLEQLRNDQPNVAAVHFALGNLYAETQWWLAAVQAYAASVRLEPAYRTDARLISDVVEALGSQHAHELAAKLIENELGAAAMPRLEQASRSTSPDLRARASRLRAALRLR
jgi:eukaryotic-like serine/threonine-protein kinase